MSKLIHNKNIATALLILMMSVFVGGGVVFVELSSPAVKVFAQGEGGTGTGGSGTGGGAAGFGGNGTAVGGNEGGGVAAGSGSNTNANCGNTSVGVIEGDRPDNPDNPGILPKICPDGSLQPSHPVCTPALESDNMYQPESCVVVYDPCPPPPPPPPKCDPISTRVNHPCNLGETGTGRTYERTSNTCTPDVWSSWALVGEDCHPTPQPPDVCPNIPGNQSSVPAGKIIDSSGNCVDGGGGGGDVCPNIAGNQSSVPAGKVIDSSGNCVDGGGGGGGDVCPNIPGVQSSVPAGKVTDSSGNCVDSGGGPRCIDDGALCGTSAENKCKMKNYAHYQCSGTTSVCPAIAPPDDALCTPPIITLKITPPEIKQGEKCSVEWTVRGIIPGVTVCGLNGVGISDGCNEKETPGSCISRPGGTLMTPALDLTTQYTLTCMNGTVESLVTKTAQCAITPIIFEPSDSSGGVI